MSPDAYIEMANTESLHWWFAGRRVIINDIVSALALKNDAKILEVGCGTGGNLEMLGKFGVVSAFEMDQVAHNIALQKSKGCHDVRLGSCPSNIPFNGEKFDLICMFDVLEHIQDDLTTLVKLRELLSIEGRLLITVPAYQFLYGPHDTFLHHQRRYSAKSLGRLINSAGFKSVKLSYFNTILFPLAVLLRIKDKLLKSNLATGTGLPSSVANKILKYIFSFESHLLTRFNLPFGVSLLGIFQVNRLQ